MKTQTLFLNEFEFNDEAKGESLILPLLLVTLTFGIFLMSSNAPDKFTPTLKTPLGNEKIAMASQSDTQKNIIDIIWACPVQSLLENGQGCGTVK